MPGFVPRPGAGAGPAGPPRGPGKSLLPPKKSPSKPGPTRGTHAVAKPLNITGLQNHLRKQGYKIPVSGQMDKKTKSALADYIKVGGSAMSPQMAAALKGVVITGKRNSKKWNYMNTPIDVSGPKPPPVSTLYGPRNKQHPDGKYSVPPPTPQKPKGPQTVDFGAGMPGMIPTMQPLSPQATMTGGAQMYGPQFMHGLDAGYNPIIEGLRKEIAAGQRRTQNNAMETRGWYDQVADSARLAGKRDAGINQDAMASIKDANRAILSSLGGGANQGGNVVADANADALSTMGAMGAAQEQYTNDMVPLLRGEGAGMAARVRSAGASNANELAQRIAQVQAERAQARSGMQLNIAQMNNDIRQGRQDRGFQIKQYNDQVAQQGFQNKLSMGQAQMAAIMTGAQLQQMRAPAATASKPSTSYPFGKAPQSIRNMAVSDAVASIEGMPYPQALQTVNQILRGYGWSIKDAAVMAMRNSILSEAGIKVDPRTQ